MVSHDLAVIRSTWDYARRCAEFLAWATATGGLTVVHNPVAMLAWNTDKRNLNELSAAGLPVIETTFLAPGSTWPVADLTHSVVVKPSVFAGG